jgi:hypothetical protein
MPSNRIPIIIAAAVAFGCSESAIAPAAQSDGPVLQASVASQVAHRVSAGGPDVCSGIGLKPGCDANFSLHATQRNDGSVSGQWQDEFARFPGFGGIGLHIAVNCLLVIGNQAWVSGVVTASRIPGDIGRDAVTSVVDNGRSANDPADQLSFSFVGTGVDCNAAPAFNLPLVDAPQGQVTVQ